MNNNKEVSKNQIDGVNVWCSFSELLDIDKFIAHPKNPNKHPNRQIEILTKIFQENGIRQPATVSTRSGLVTRGHGRILAAKALGLSKYPVEYQQYEDESHEIADLIADNKIKEMSEWDFPKLDELLIELDNGTFDMEITGFDFLELEKKLAPVSFGQEVALPEPTATEAIENKPTDLGVLHVPSSHVRMVQLFLSQDNIGEFLQMTEKLQSFFQTGNLTDTVYETIRAQYKSVVATV
jgi:hypothetical protein